MVEVGDGGGGGWWRIMNVLKGLENVKLACGWVAE